MNKYTGTPASGGLATGKIKVINRRIAGFKRVVLAPHREKALYDAALILAKDEVRNLIRNSSREQQDILNFQLVMLDDRGMNRMINEHIDNGKGAAVACELAMEEYCQRLRDIGDPYLAERTSDIRDVLSRVIDILDGRTRERFALTEPSVIVADEILPSDLARIDRRYALGFVTVGGSYQAHANIIARTMGIPSVCLVSGEILNPLNNGRQICIDGYSGELIISPDESTLNEFSHRIRAENRAKEAISAYKEKKINLADGEEVEIWANCNDPRDIEEAVTNGAEGIGLVRSEILFLKDVYPTFDIQLDFYSRCKQAAKDIPIIIRVFDIGADKHVEGIQFGKEPNPALGVRGIRLQHRHRAVFETQLRALYIAADRHGEINVMLPMVSVEKDITDYLEMAEIVKTDMLEKGEITKDNIVWGIMIETPSAALVSDRLAKYVSFFSIGTNDLTQYTMRADRMNPETRDYYKPCHPAVLSLMKMTVENAKRAGVKVSVCGESAADAKCALKYIDIGIRYLSMAQGSMIPVKEKLMEYLAEKENQR